MRVFEFQEVPEPMIVMECYPDGSISDTVIVDNVKFVSATGQILDGLSHLHVRGLAKHWSAAEDFSQIFSRVIFYRGYLHISSRVVSNSNNTRKIEHENQM